MNEKTARQIEEMKKQTIGVEVEMNSITREKAAKIAAEFFGTRRYQSTARLLIEGITVYDNRLIIEFKSGTQVEIKRK